MECPLMELSVLFGTLLLVIYVYFKHAHTYWKKRGVPQLEPSFPFGDMATVILRKQNMGDKIRDVYAKTRAAGRKYVGLYFFSRRAFMPVDPALIKNILSQDFAHFHDRGIYYDEENDPLSAHLFSLAGTKWRTLRTKLTPAFSPGRLRCMVGTMLGTAERMIDAVAASEGAIEIKDLLARYTTDLIGSCAFGIECNSIDNPNAEFRLMGRRAFTQTAGDAFRMVVMRSFPQIAKWFGFGVFTSTVTKFFRRAVQDTIEYRERNNVRRNDFLQLLIQLKNNDKLETDNQNEMLVPVGGTSLTMDEAAAQAFIFFLAGFETTSTTTSFSLFEMAVNFNIQRKARNEVNHVLGKYNGQITYDALMEMNYLETVILEAMRKYPPAPVFLRKCTKEYRLPGTDVVIEEGLSVLIPAYGLHRDPEYFPNPDQFDPDRFNSENKSKISSSHTYIPFGDGPRVCIGMRFALIQMKIALSLLLKNFQISLDKKTILPLKMETRGIILTASGGIWLDIKSIIDE